jgi:hypothetical protein
MHVLFGHCPRDQVPDFTLDAANTWNLDTFLPPRPFGAARPAGSHPYLASGFQGRCKVATIHASFGLMRGIAATQAVASSRARVVRPAGFFSPCNAKANLRPGRFNNARQAFDSWCSRRQSHDPRRAVRPTIRGSLCPQPCRPRRCRRKGRPNHRPAIPWRYLVRQRATLLARPMVRVWRRPLLAVIANRLCLDLRLKSCRGDQGANRSAAGSLRISSRRRSGTAGPGRKAPS